MIVPKLILTDFLFLPEDDIDLKIWINEFLEQLIEEQPILHEYLRQCLLRYGENTVCSGIFVFKAIEEALLRNV